jgi:hypothetical protein
LPPGNETTELLARPFSPLADVEKGCTKLE